MTIGNKQKSIIKLIAASFIIGVALDAIGGYISLNVKLVVGFITFFLLVFYLLQNTQLPNKNLAFSLITWFPFITFLCFNIFQFKATWASFGSNLFICLGCVAGYFYFNTRKFIVPIILASLIPVWFLFIDKPLHDKFTYGSYNQKVLSPYPADISLYDTTNATQNFNNPSKFYVLDFWNSKCGVCYQRFPIVDEINKKTDNTKCEIVAINIPILKEKKEDNFSILNKYNYSFKKLFAENRSVADSFGVMFYPTTLVVKNNQIIFRGDFEDAIKEFHLIP